MRFVNCNPTEIHLSTIRKKKHFFGYRFKRKRAQWQWRTRDGNDYHIKRREYKKNAMIFELGSGSRLYFAIGHRTNFKMVWNNATRTIYFLVARVSRNRKWNIDKKKIQNKKEGTKKNIKVKPDGIRLKTNLKCAIWPTASIRLTHFRSDMNGFMMGPLGVVDDRVTCHCVLLRKSRAATKDQIRRPHYHTPIGWPASDSDSICSFATLN